MNALIACRLIMIFAICLRDIGYSLLFVKVLVLISIFLSLMMHMSLSNLSTCKLCIFGISVALYIPANQLLKYLQQL